MAKTKLITRAEYQKASPEEKFACSSESPVSSINLPLEKTIGFFLQRDLMCYGTNGTFYCVRYNPKDFPSVININAHSFTFKSNEERTEIKEVAHEYHRLPDLPEFLKSAAPDEIMRRLARVFSRESPTAGDSN